MAITEFASGRAGGAAFSIEIIGLNEFLKRGAAQDPLFNKEVRKASVELVGKVVVQVRAQATYAPNPRQAIQAAQGFRALSDRIPTIKLRSSSEFISKSRPSKKRKRPVTRGDVFFGSEFGSDRFRQFPPRTPKLGSGNQGYFFWPTIEAMAPTINREYLAALDRITRNLERL
jgi:hypothetical protein